MRMTRVKILLNNHSDTLKKSLTDFKRSIDKCKEINLNSELSFEEQESLDALSSKFARISDIFTQKIIKSVAIIYRENCKTFIDRINFAEKIGLISEAKKLLEIRDLRNEISHEYVDENLMVLYENVIELSQELVVIVNDALSFIAVKEIFQIEQ